MTVKEANAIVGGLSTPSKMPGFGYGLPAKECKTGGILRKVAGSTCEKCYALKGNYMWPKIQSALYNRLEKIKGEAWVSAMVFLINYREKKGQRFFRWHDSGDITDIVYLRKIVAVCEQTPKVYHWLPTREYGIVSDFIKEGGVIPANLNIRLSGFMVDGPAPSGLAKRLGCTTSSVASKGNGFTCPASLQDNKCMDCRACWEKGVENVTYKKH